MLLPLSTFSFKYISNKVASSLPSQSMKNLFSQKGLKEYGQEQGWKEYQEDRKLWPALFLDNKTFQCRLNANQ